MPIKVINNVSYLSTREVAKRLGVSPRTIQRRADRNGENGKPVLDFIRDPFSGHRYFTEDSVNQLVKELFGNNGNNNNGSDCNGKD